MLIKANKRLPKFNNGSFWKILWYAFKLKPLSFRGQCYKTNTVVIYCHCRLNYHKNIYNINLTWNYGKILQYDSKLLQYFNPRKNMVFVHQKFTMKNYRNSFITLAPGFYPGAGGSGFDPSTLKPNLLSDPFLRWTTFDQRRRRRRRRRNFSNDVFIDASS